jgi:WD40 repeat protein
VIQALLAQARAWRGQPWLCPRFPSLTVVGGPLWRTLEGHTDWVAAVAIADGRVISGSHDHTVRVWDLASAQERARWEGDAAFKACDAMVLDTDAGDDGPSLVIVAGDAGGRVHCLQLLGDSAAATSAPKEG